MKQEKMRQVKIYCADFMCCATGCWGLTNLKPILDKANITFSRIGFADAERLGIKYGPTIIFMKNKHIADVITGKNVDGKILEKLKSLGWL